LSPVCTLDKAYYKALEVEKLDKLYPVRRVAPLSTPSYRIPAKSVRKMNESFVSASISKSQNPQIPPRIAPIGWSILWYIS